MAGSRSDLTARLQPFKQFEAIVPADAVTGEPIPLNSGRSTSRAIWKKPSQSAPASLAWITAASGSQRRSTRCCRIGRGVVDKDSARQVRECHVPDGLMNLTALGLAPDSEVELV